MIPLVIISIQDGIDPVYGIVCIPVKPGERQLAFFESPGITYFTND